MPCLASLLLRSGSWRNTATAVRDRCGDPVLVGRSRAEPSEEREFYYMKDSISSVSEQEPMGIVISRGSRQEATPMFFAYVWAPAPEDTDSLEVQAA